MLTKKRSRLRGKYAETCDMFDMFDMFDMHCYMVSCAILSWNIDPEESM